MKVFFVMKCMCLYVFSGLEILTTTSSCKFELMFLSSSSSSSSSSPLLLLFFSFIHFAGRDGHRIRMKLLYNMHKPLASKVHWCLHWITHLCSFTSQMNQSRNELNWWVANVRYQCLMFFGRKWINISSFPLRWWSFRFLLLQFAVKKWLFSSSHFMCSMRTWEQSVNIWSQAIIFKFNAKHHTYSV